MQSDNGTRRRTPRWIWGLAFLIAVAVLPGAAMVQSQENTPPVAQSVFSPVNQGNVGVVKPIQAPTVFRQQAQIQPAQIQPAQIQPAQKTPVDNPGLATSNFRSSSSQFDPNAAKKKFDAAILKMVKDKDERKKISEELKDKAWHSYLPRVQLCNCKNKPVDVEIRLARVSKSFADEFLGSSELTTSPSRESWGFSEHQFPVGQLEELIDAISEANDASITAPSSQKFYAKAKESVPTSVHLHRSFVSGFHTVSILNPSNVKPSICLLYTSPSPRDATLSRMPSSA